MAKKSNPSVSNKKWIIENLTSLGSALLIVLMIRSSVIEAFKIPSGSMIPTLLVGDHIFVNKFAYGLKVPFAEWLMDEPLYLYKGAPPQRGNIIVFKYPEDESIYYIKRVIGTPGDTIEIRNKQLYVNNEAIAIESVDTKTQDETLKVLADSREYTLDNLQLHRERLGTQNPLIMADRGGYLTENFGPIEVPPESLFVMGDNRDHSRDSRFWGFVPYRNVKGRAFIVWLSVWLDFSKKEFTFHPERIGTLLN